MSRLPPDDRATVAAVKARLLPPSSAGARLERWVERLPRRCFVPRCLPLQQLAPVAGSAERWTSLGEDPAFLLDFGERGLPRGWVYLEVALQRSMGNRVAMLHIDRGQGFESGQGLFIPSNLRGSVRELVFIPRDAVALRWDPCEARGHFTQSPLVFHEVGFIERRLRMADRVSRRAEAHGIRFAEVLRLGGLRAAYARVRAQTHLSAANAYQAYLSAERARQPADAAPLPLAPVAAVGVRFVLHRGWDGAGAAPPEPAWIRRVGHPPADVRLIDWSRPDAAAQAREECARPDAWHLLLRAGDELADGALGRLARAILANPQARVVYADHDWVDAAGARVRPSFKPDWDPDLYATHDYIAAPCALSARLPAMAQRWSRRPTPADAVALVLDAAAASDGSAIVHVAQVLCHRRDDPAQLHPYGGEPAQPEVVAAHPLYAGADVERGRRPGTSRLVWPLPSPPPRVCAIVPTRDRVELLEACLRSLRRHADPGLPLEILVVDNDSAEPGSRRFLASLVGEPGVRVVAYPGPFNFSAINNHAAARTDAELLLFLNNDVEAIEDGWLEALVRQALRPGVGAVGAKLLYPDRTVQHAGVVMGIGGVAGHVHRFLPADEPGYGGRAEVAHAFSAVTGACLMLARRHFDAAGGFNPRLAVAFNDVDLCLRLRRLGLRNLLEPRARLIHHESLSRGVDDTPQKRETYRRERDFMLLNWPNEITADPAYNPHLSRDHEDFSVRSLPAHRAPRAA